MSATLAFILKNGAGLEAICPVAGCGDVRTLDVEGLARAYGDQVTVDQLAPRLRCRRCGHKGLQIEGFARRHGPIG